MKKILILSLLSAVFLIGNVSAQTAKNGLDILVPEAQLLSDDFEAYPVGSTFPVSPWTPSAMADVWAITEDGGSRVARQPASGTWILTNGNVAWTDYAVSARVKPGITGFRQGIIGRYSSSGAYYRMYLNSQDTTRRIVLEKRVGGSNVSIAFFNLPAINAGTYYKLTLEMNGSTLKGYVDDVLRITATDTAYTAGKIGFYCTNDSFYDDVLVQDFLSPPAAPANLTATGGSGQISLTWSSTAGATSYKVKRSTVDGGPYTEITDVSTTSYVDTTAANNVPYFYVVTAGNANGQSANSNQATGTSILVVPGVPGSLESAAGNGTVRVHWVASTGVVSYYNVKRSSASSGTYTTVATNITTLEFTETGLANGTTYYYRVSAVNAAGESANSGVTFQTPRVGTIVNVTTDSQLATAFAGAVSGDEIILADGNYSGIKMRRKFGTALKPIVVRAQNPLGAVFNAGQFELDRTDYITIKDFKFTLSNEIKLRGTEYCRLTGNSFEFNETGITDRDWISLGSGESNHNRIDHNDFKNKVTLGNFITQVGSLGQISQYDLIDHNYFFNLGPRAENEKEAIRLGDSSVSTSSGFAIVEYNLFEQCDGDAEIVSIKTHDNIARYNTFRRSKGALTSRQGNRNQMYGNFFFGEGVSQTGGIRAYGDDHKIYNNYFEGLTASDTLPSENYGVISLTSGDADGAELPGADQSKHYRPQRILIANNTLVGNNYGIEIGGSYTLPPRDITINNNLIVGSTNKLVNHIAEPINSTYAGNIAFPTGTATVGITANSSQITVADPLLVLQNGIQVLGSGSPAIDASAVNYAFITDDIEGQMRIGINDVGSDEFGGPAPQRLPLVPSNSGRNATGLSISGRIADENGQGIPAVTVSLSAGGGSPTLVGTTIATLPTDSSGYYNFTDVLPGLSYSLTVSKPSYTFTPNTFSIAGLNGDTIFSPIGDDLAPTAANVRIAGRVVGENQQPINSVVKLTSPDGTELTMPTSSFGYFSFEGVESGQTYVLSATSKLRVFAPQVLSVSDDLTELVISPIQ